MPAACPSVCAGSQSQSQTWCQIVRRMKRSWLARGASCLQAPAEMSENGMCASSAAAQVAASPPVGLAGGGQRASMHRAAHPDGPMRPKETRTRRGKKQKEGREAEKQRMKSKKRGTTTLPCSLGENRLQRSRFRLARTIICTHEQTAKPTIHALADPSCRHVLCVAPICPHIDFSCLECYFCPPRFAHLGLPTSTWPAVVAFAIMSDPICPQRDLSQVDSS